MGTITSPITASQHARMEQSSSYIRKVVDAKATVQLAKALPHTVSLA